MVTSMKVYIMINNKEENKMKMVQAAKSNKVYAIYELTPAPWGDAHRHIQTFDTKKDAEHVLSALEKVNIDFNLYKIVKYEV